MPRNARANDRLTELAASLAKEIEASGQPIRTIDDDERSAPLHEVIETLGRAGHAAPWGERVDLDADRRLRLAFDPEQGAEAWVERDVEPGAPVVEKGNA